MARASFVRSLILMLLASCGGSACKLVHPPYADPTDSPDASAADDGADAAGATTDTHSASGPQSTSESAQTTEPVTTENGTTATATNAGSSESDVATGAQSNTHDLSTIADDSGPNDAIPDAGDVGTTGLGDTEPTSSVGSGSGVSGETDAATDCVHLTNPAFLDFANVSPVTANGGDATWEFTLEGGVTGTVYVASQNLTSEIVAGSPAKLHMSGLVAEYAQFGVHFTPCIDASSFSGVTVELDGDVGPSNSVRVEVQLTSSTMHTNNSEGTCVPRDPNQWWNDCSHPDRLVTILSPSAPVDSPWSEFTGGVPNESPVPSTITGLEIEFDWNESLGASIDADLTVSKIAFWP